MIMVQRNRGRNGRHSVHIQYIYNVASKNILITLSMPYAQSVNDDDGTRIPALALAESGIADRIVTPIIEISHQTISCLEKQARDKGYNLNVFKKLLTSYLTDKSRI